ncbi:MAG TPA: DinB family protein [Granulicella sp.]|nr:DinB family protein [Granulicella sp.]
MNPLTALTAEELIAWNDTTAERWFTFLAANPTLLATPCDIHDADTVGKFLQHIAAAELRHAERLAGAPISEYDSVPYATVNDLQATHNRTIALLRSLLTDPTIDWAGEMEFTTITAGRRRCSRRAILFHAMLHGIRHYAQLATLVRQAGFTPNIPGDYLLMASHPA